MKGTTKAKKNPKVKKSVKKARFHSIGATTHTRQDSQCLTYADFLFTKGTTENKQIVLKTAEGQCPPQELEVGPRIKPYLLVVIICDFQRNGLNLVIYLTNIFQGFSLYSLQSVGIQSITAARHPPSHTKVANVIYSFKGSGAVSKI